MEHLILVDQRVYLHESKRYVKSGRLQDVLALIQVLAFDPHTHRSEDGVLAELQDKPISSDSWVLVAKEHPEFFRVRTEGKHVLSLVARHVLPKDATGNRPMSPEIAYKLLETAIDLHDREVQQAERWKAFIPLWAVVIAGVLGTFSTLATLWWKGCAK